MRMTNAGADVDTSGHAFGVQASIEAAIRLFVYDRYLLAMQGGPDVRWLADAPGSAPRFGFSLGLSLGARLEDR
jgi:hypothetical protein